MDIKEFREHIEKWEELKIASDARILKEILLNTIQCAELWEMADNLVQSLINDNEYLQDEVERLQREVSNLEDDVWELRSEINVLESQVES